MTSGTPTEGLPERLHGLRGARGLSQAALARKARITQGTVSNYETGKREVPLGTAMRLAAVLDVTLGDLIELEIEHLVIRGGSKLARATEILEASPELLDRILRRAAGA